QQQSPDVTSIDVGVRHQDDLVISNLIDFESPLVGDSATECRYQGRNCLRGKHSIKACSLDVQDLSAQRKDCLKVSISPLLCAATCRVTLHDVQFTDRRILALTIRQFATE